MKKTKKIIFLLIINIFIIIFTVSVYSCEKREPEGQPVPHSVMKKVLGHFDRKDDINSECVIYISGQKDKELSEKKAQEIYSKLPEKNEKNGKSQGDLIDLSKIEKYSIRQSKKNPAVEIGIFKLYDKINANYVREMSSNRIIKLQENIQNIQSVQNDAIKTANNAEVRIYGNYVYYVSHAYKDEIFQIIENALREKV